MKLILEIKNLIKHFDGITALDDFSCDLHQGEIVGLIGPNGAGKTTLFNVLTGFIEAESGSISFRGKNITSKPPYRIVEAGIARTFQNLRLIRQMTVLENVLLAFQQQKGERFGDVYFRRRKYAGIEEANRARALELLGVADMLNKADDLADNLSYGQQKLLSLVCCLATDAELILLDEPVAGINPAMIEKILRIIGELRQKSKSVIVIEHNMDAIREICDRVIFMDTGKKVSEGTAEEVRNDPRVIEAYLE